MLPPGRAGAGARRKVSTWAEKLLWSWLRDRRFNGYKFRREHPVGVYVLDFFCEEARLAVEMDGFGHGHPRRQSHDAMRTKFLTTQGIVVLRFWNSHLRRDAQSIRNAIFQALQARAAHPLPDYTRPGGTGEISEQGSTSPRPSPPRRGRPISIAPEASSNGGFFHTGSSMSPLPRGEG
jgi:very-short-patch-repair endonuclease